MDRGRRRTSVPGARHHCRGRRAEVRPVGYCSTSQPGPRVSVWAVALPSVGHVKPRNTYGGTATAAARRTDRTGGLTRWVWFGLMQACGRAFTFLPPALPLGSQKNASRRPA
jgi:hypothetical protein